MPELSDVDSETKNGWKIHVRMTVYNDEGLEVSETINKWFGFTRGPANLFTTGLARSILDFLDGLTKAVDPEASHAMKSSGNRKG